MNVVLEGDRKAERLAELKAGRRQELKSQIDRVVSLFELTEMPASGYAEHDGTSRRDDLASDIPVDMTASEFVVGHQDWWLAARAVNLTQFVGQMGEGAHVEAREGGVAAHLQAGQRPFFSRPPIEYVHHLDAVKQRDGGDLAIVAVRIPEAKIDGHTVGTSIVVVECERQYLAPSNARHQSTWKRLKWSKGRGPRLRKGGWVWSPQRYIVVDHDDPESAIDTAWRWANELDPHAS